MKTIQHIWFLGIEDFRCEDSIFFTLVRPVHTTLNSRTEFLTAAGSRSFCGQRDMEAWALVTATPPCKAGLFFVCSFVFIFCYFILGNKLPTALGEHDSARQDIFVSRFTDQTVWLIPQFYQRVFDKVGGFRVRWLEGHSFFFPK